MAANSKSHAISQTAYAGADGHLYAIWEIIYGVKGLNLIILWDLLTPLRQTCLLSPHCVMLGAANDGGQVADKPV